MRPWKGDFELLEGTERRAKSTICPLELYGENQLAEAGLCAFQLIQGLLGCGQNKAGAYRGPYSLALNGKPHHFDKIL